MQPRIRQARFIIIYQCPACGHESGYTELDRPTCRFCTAKSGLTVVSRKKLTRKVLKARLKTTTNNMMTALKQAYELLPTVPKSILGDDKDAELELLNLMARAKELRDKVQSLPIRKRADR